MYRTGFGYDLHRLERGRKLILGGVEVADQDGLAGHSDGDCLTHAVIDALLGAAGEADIGRHFPDTEPRWKGARSVELLAVVMEKLRIAGWRVENVDSVIVAQKPLLAPYIPAMKQALAPVLGVGPEAIGIKAKTNEGLGLIGKGRAVACWASVLVRRDRT